MKYLPTGSGYRYAIGNCIFEAAFENVLERCNCYPGYNHGLIADHNLALKPCTGSNLTCMSNILYRVGQYDHVNVGTRKMKCRSSCEDQVNELFVTTLAYPNEKTFRYRQEFCILIKRLLQKCSNYRRRSLEKSYSKICTKLDSLVGVDPAEYCPNNQWNPRDKRFNCTDTLCPIEENILHYSRKNLVIFHVLIKDPYAKRFQRDEKIAITSFIANMGGLLGLWLGFSWISGAEILFYITSGVFSSISERHKGTEKKRQQVNGVESEHDLTSAI